ncbi:thioredoxin domain-containing protein [Streptomyces sp. V4-01]|uniref:Thioredoxin domain-containing protein n=1 Tax=Actinacidiphila polyblastidii TaxID=3110430 RepID=A0ABU7PFF5_9ACTN|nr:thioredoxin domain-containing protein [Streptomyces sp. V4-01]
MTTRERGKADTARSRRTATATATAVRSGVALLAAMVLAGCGGSGSGGAHAQGKASASASASTATASAPTGGASAPPPPPAPPASTAPPAPPTTPPPAAGTLPSRLEADGTTITVGDPAAPHTVAVYEDPRCPVCARFEAANAKKLTALAASGKVRLQYTLASFLDVNFGGGGSKRAVNALRAAVPENRFAPLHALVYAHQPDESQDGFTVAYLLELAGRVPGLRTPAFDAAVRGQSYGSFVTRSETAFTASGATGTPTVRIDGTVVSGGGADIVTAAGFARVLRQHGLG